MSKLIEAIKKASYHKPGSNTRGLDLDTVVAIVRQHEEVTCMPVEEDVTAMPADFPHDDDPGGWHAREDQLDAIRETFAEKHLAQEMLEALEAVAAERWTPAGMSEATADKVRAIIAKAKEEA